MSATERSAAFEWGFEKGEQAERERIIKLLTENGGITRFISRTALDSNNDDVEWAIRAVDLIAEIKGENK